MRRIDLDGVGVVVEKVDRIGDLGDGLSRAASRSRRSRGSVLGDLDMTRQDNTTQNITVGGGSAQKRPRSRDQVVRNPNPIGQNVVRNRGQSTNPLRSNHSQSHQNLRPAQFNSVHQPINNSSSKLKPNPLFSSNYINTSHQQTQRPQPVVIKQSPRVVIAQHTQPQPQRTQPVIRQRPQQTYSNNYYSQPQSIQQTPPQQQYRNPVAIQINGNIRQGTPPRFQTRRKERTSIGQYSATKVQISRTVEQEPTEVEIIEGVNSYGQNVNKRIYTSVNRTVVEEVSQNV